MIDMSVTERFTKAFDSMNTEHVAWLGRLFAYSRDIGAATMNIDDFINTNPMGVRFEKSDTLSWIHIHFALAMKYSQDVLTGKAWIPPSVDRAR